jgi:bla regulator protein blaR1
MRSFALEALGAIAGRLIWLGLVHSIWIGLLSAAVVALILQSVHRLSHRARHTIFLLAMVGVAAGPVAVTFLQQWLSSRITRTGSE